LFIGAKLNLFSPILCPVLANHFSILYFNDWESLTISRFDPHTEKWSHLNESTIEPLKDLCEVKFADSTICLYGFGKQTGHWVEWKIRKAKMHAEFDA